MPELPPPPPPPLSIGAALVDTLQRHRPTWLTARAASGAVAAVAVVLAALVALGWSPRQQEPPEIVLPRAGTPGDPSFEADDPAGGDTRRDEATATTVAVHAAGAFAKPGLYLLPAGARVAQLVEAAGGPAPGALLDALNLAAKLNDGERVYLPREGEVPVESVAGAAGGSAAGGAAASSSGVVDLNTATLEQLDALPGVGPSTAQAILDYRQERGRFRSVEELLEVRGIGEAKLSALRRRVRV